MIDILRHVHQNYVPKHEDTIYPVFFGGDQLTSERGRNSQLALQDHDTSEDRLEGLICVTEDWHAKVVLLQVIFKMLYFIDSSSDKGTLRQLKDVVNRRRISPENITSNVSATSAFLNLITDAYVTNGAMNLLGMSSVESVPPGFSNFEHKSAEEQDALLQSVATNFVDVYVLRDCDKSVLGGTAAAFEITRQTQYFPCRFEGCSKQYRHKKNQRCS